MALVPWPTSKCKRGKCQSEKLGFAWKSWETRIRGRTGTRRWWFKEETWEFARCQLLPMPVTSAIESFSAKPSAEDRTRTTVAYHGRLVHISGWGVIPFVGSLFNTLQTARPKCFSFIILAAGWPLNSSIVDKRMGVLNEFIGAFSRGKTNASIYPQTGWIHHFFSRRRNEGIGSTSGGGETDAQRYATAVQFAGGYPSSSHSFTARVNSALIIRADFVSIILCYAK